MLSGDENLAMLLQPWFPKSRLFGMGRAGNVGSWRFSAWRGGEGKEGFALLWPLRSPILQCKFPIYVFSAVASSDPFLAL